MIFQNCNYVISGFHPSPDGGTSSFNFHIGLKKEFAKRALEMQLPERGLITFREFENGLMKQMGWKDQVESYQFIEHKLGKDSCLLGSVEVPGTNSCHLAAEDFRATNLDKINKYNKYLEYHPHNIDNPRQAYSLLSLFSKWADLMDTMLNP